MTNYYHIVDKLPAFDKKDMPPEKEELAMQIISLGLLRVDDDEKRNFARFSDPSGDEDPITFTARELYKQDLLSRTKKKIEAILKKNHTGKKLQKKVNSSIKNLRKDVNKYPKFKPDFLIKLARLLVQSADNTVIKWLIRDKVSIFLTYSQSIGDIMDIKTWQHAGQNSGMQSIGGVGISIFVSSGGNPLRDYSEEVKLAGNGLPAIARLQIIAAQEIAHYADIMRDSKGNFLGRYSSTLSLSEPNPYVAKLRTEDAEKTQEFKETLNRYKFDKLVQHEQSLKFYHQNEIKGIRPMWHKFWIAIYKPIVKWFCRRRGFKYVERFNYDHYMGIMLNSMLDDMLFNLAPKADVYKSNDPNKEEAIKCAEALARVPQQAIKWGYSTTKFFMEGLYRVYYKKIIPDMKKNYQKMDDSNKTASDVVPKPEQLSKTQKVFKAIKNITIFRKNKNKYRAGSLTKRDI